MTIFGKAASLRGVVVDWREVATVAPRYWIRVLDRDQGVQELNEPVELYLLQSRPATDSMAKMTKVQRDFPDTEGARRWGKPWRLVVSQNLEKRVILRRVPGD